MMSTARTTRRRLAAAAAGLCVLLSLGGRDAAQAAGTPAGSPSYLFLVFSDPVPGQEAAYARWFADPSHARLVAAVPGVGPAEHFVPGPELRHAPLPTPHDLLFYRIATDRPDETARAVSRLGAEGEAWPGPAIATVHTATYKALAPAVKGVGGEPEGAKAGEKADYVVMAFHNVVGGQDQAFNTWYDSVHLPELLSKPGVVGGQRGVLSAEQFGPDAGASPRYAMLMRIETSDLPAVFAGVLKGGPPSPAIDREHSFGFTYRAAPPPA